MEKAQELEGVTMARDITAEDWKQHKQMLDDTKKPACFRLSISTLAQLEAISKQSQTKKTEVLTRAINRMFSDVCGSESQRDTLNRAMDLIRRCL